MESKALGHFVVGWLVTAIIMTACISWKCDFRPSSDVATGAFIGIAVSLVAVILVGIFEIERE